MKKFDTFQALTRGEKSLVAILLVVLISLGGVFAKTTYSHITAAKAELAQALPTPTNVSEPSVSTYYPEEDTTVVEPATVPYFVDFDENVDTNLVITNGENVNKWYIGQAQGFNNNKLYISSTNGLTNKYNVNSASEVTVSRDIMIPAAGAVVNFDYRVNGEIQGDYVKVAVGSMVVVLRPTEGWENYTLNVPGTMAGVQTLTITWINDRGNGEQFPAAIDNISITEVACAQVSNLNAAVDSTTATITWNAPESQNDWTLEYRLTNHTEWYSVSATTPSVVLNNLQGNSTYDFRVKANCGEESSVWTYGTFAVDCQNWSQDPSTVVVGTGTIGANNLPLSGYYNYSYSQQLFTQSELADLGIVPGTTINSIAFNYYYGTTTQRDIDMWVGTTSTTSLSSSFVSVNGLTQVYSGCTEFSNRNSNWFTMNFNTPYVYEGGNLIIATRSTKNTECFTSYSSDSRFYTHSVTGKARYYSADGTTPITFNAGGMPMTSSVQSGYSNSSRDNIKFNVIIPSCGDVISCPDLAGLEVDDITYNSATIDWTLAEGSSQNNFVVEYKLENSSEWTVVPVQDATTLALSNLNQLSNYNVRVKAVCGENDYSNYVTADFATPGVCASVTDITASNSANSTTLTWLAGGEEAAWTVEFRPVGTENWVSLHVGIIPMTTLGGLVGSTPYEVRIKALCDAQDEANQSAWTYYYFTSGCAAVDIPYTQVFGSYTEPACWSNQDFEFNYPSYAATNDINAWLMSPAINIPAEGTTYVSFKVQPTSGSYTLLASYRGTAMARFEEIYAGANTDNEVFVEVPEIYKGRMVNFMFRNDNDIWFYVYNMKVNTCPFVPTNIAAEVASTSSIELTWEGNITQTTYMVQYGEEGFELGSGTIINAEGNTAVINGLEYGNTYDFYVKSVCAEEWQGPVNKTVEFAFIMGQQASITTCNGVVYDNGGPDGNYTNRADDVMTIYPATPNSLIHISGDYNTESGYDKIYVYDGESTSATQLAELSGVSSLDFTSTVGALTIRFTSDGSSTRAGFGFTVECTPIPTCAVPDMVVVGSVATITRGSFGEPVSYDLQIGDEVVTGVQSPANLLELFPSLQFSTEYEVVVRANCGEGDYSDWSSPVTFTMPACANPCVYTLEMQDLYTDGWNGAAVQLYVNNQLQESYTVPNGSNANNVTVSNCAEGDLVFKWYKGSYDNECSFILKDAAGQTLYSISGASSLSTGDVLYSSYCGEIPTCAVPSITVADGVATIAAGSFGTPDSYDLQIGNEVVTDVQSPANLTVLFPSLQPNTEYEVAVRANCGESDYSNWSNPVSFRTPCAAISLPYAENFDSYSDVRTTAYGVTVMPDCWKDNWTAGLYSSSYASGSYSPSISSYSSYNPGSTQYLYMMAYTSSYSYPYYQNPAIVILPAFENELNTTQITFRARCSSQTSGNLKLGYVEGENFTELTTVTCATSANAPEQTISLASYTGIPANAKLAFKATSTSYSYYVGIDDIYVEVIPTCLKPTITVDGTIATISTTQTPESYDLHIDGFQDRTVYETTVDLATIFTDLANSSFYQVTVRANCGGGDYSSWSGPATFTTPCGITRVPYFEGFEAYTTGQSSPAPNCWNLLNRVTSSSSSYPQAYVNNTAPYVKSGSKSLYFKSSSTTPVYAVMPPFDNGIERLAISFWYRNEGVTASDGTIILGLMTNPEDASTFIGLKTLTKVNTMTEVEYDFSLSTYSGSNYYIAFKYQGGTSNNYYASIDDINVELLPTCFTPEDLSVALTDTSAVITWADRHSQSNYVVEYKEATAETWNTATATEMTYTITGLIPSTDYDVRVKADCGEGDQSEYATADFTTYCIGYYFVEGEMVCPNPTDLTISGIRTPLTACEVNDPVTILVKNTGIVYPIAGFTAHYILNEGDTVTEPVTLATELEPGQEMAYSFNTLPTYEPGFNMVYAWIELEGFELEYNYIYDYPYVVTPNTVPYVMDTVPEENLMGWNAFDENNDDITLNLRNRVISYTYNDMMAANDWMISPCFNLTAGTYNIIFDYQANSSLSEQFALYFGQGPTPEDMTQLLSQFVTVDEEAHSVMVPVTVAEDGTYNFGFYTNTSAGNMGFKIRNIEVLPVLNVTVTTDGNGTANPSGVIPVNYGENLTLMVTPNEMYHLGGIYLDSVKVVNEDPSGAGFMLYTLENVTADHNVYVEFKLEFRIIKSVENENAAYTDVPGYFIPAATDTVIDPSPFTVNFRPAHYYHFTTLELGILSLDEPIDVTDAVVANEDGSYSYTIDTLVVSHYYLNALFDRDKVNINYNVLTGKGYANDSEVLAAPESYTTVVDHSVNGDIDTTVTIAPYTTGDAHSDYHIIDVTVDGQSQGIIDNYTFTDVIADHTIDIKYGFHVNATVRNYEPFNLGSTEIRGTIEPALQLLAEGDATTVSGTVQEHFHLYNLFVDGVDMMNDVTVVANPEGGYSYTYTIDSTIANYNIEAVVKLDTVGIHYHVVAGQGYADNSPLLNEGDNYTTHISFADSILTNVMPAPGYSISSYELEGFDMGAINNYQFNAVMREYFINLTFVPNDIEIVTNAYGHGAVSEGMNFTYNPETPVNYNFIATPEVGYHIVSVTINGEAEPVVDPASFTYTINNVSQDYVFDVIFALNTYTISAAATENGTITPMGTQSVNYGQSVVYTAAANEGAYIAEVTVDGQTTSFTQADNVVSYVIPFNAISANHTVSVVFSVKEFNVQASVDAASLGHGTVEGANTYSTTVNYGQNAGIHIVPATNYHVSALVVDGNEVPATQYYEFVNVQANHNLIASFAIDQYEMTAISNTPACTITPAQTTVNAGSNVTYTLTVAPGYHLVNVLDNGNEVTVSNNSFTVYNVTENHVINANFATNNVTVTVNQPAHATINPGTQVVAYGATPSYVIVPQTGYQVVSVTAGNAVVDVTYSNGVGSFTLAPVYQDITVTANVVPQSYTITVSKEGQGTVTPGVDQTVTYGSNKTFNIAPAAHYVISDVLVDGVSKGAITSYTFVNVTANHTIKAIFEGNCEVPVDLQASQITSNSAVLTWSNTGAVSYIVTYKAYNEAAAHEATTTTNSYTATGLNADAIYSWSVKAVCAASLQSVTSETAYFQTTPASACAAPQNLTVLAESNESAAVSWTSDASAFNLRYKRQGDPESTYAYVYNYTETSYTFLFLLSNTAYDWGVQAVCNAVTGNVSEWSNGTFTTTTTGIASADLSSIKVYSHLNNVYIVNEEGINISEVNIFDIYGKKIYEGNVNNNPEVISLDVANGNYIVRLNTENGVAVYKLAIIR